MSDSHDNLKTCCRRGLMTINCGFKEKKNLPKLQQPENGGAYQDLRAEIKIMLKIMENSPLTETSHGEKKKKNLCESSDSSVTAKCGSRCGNKPAKKKFQHPPPQF